MQRNINASFSASFDLLLFLLKVFNDLENDLFCYQTVYIYEEKKRKKEERKEKKSTESALVNNVHVSQKTSQLGLKIFNVIFNQISEKKQYRAKGKVRVSER